MGSHFHSGDFPPPLTCHTLHILHLLPLLRIYTCPVLGVRCVAVRLPLTPW